MGWKLNQTYVKPEWMGFYESLGYLHTISTLLSQNKCQSHVKHNKWVSMNHYDACILFLDYS